MINQTSFVDLSLVETSTATFGSTTSVPLLESTTLASEMMSTVREDSHASADPPSMFSTSMVPPRPTPADQEEELITTSAPIVQEDHEDIDPLTDFDVSEFGSDNLTDVEFISQRGDTFEESHIDNNTTGTVSKPVDEADDLSVIEINTVQPDVPIPVASLITEPMFAEGKTEETILDPGITTGISFDLSDTPTDLVDPTGEDTFSSYESMPTSIYDSDTDEIESAFAVEALPPTRPPPQQTPSSSPVSSTDRTDIDPTDTTSVQSTQTASKVEIISTASPQTTHKKIPQTPPLSQDVESPTVVTTQTKPAAVTSSAVLLDGEILTENASAPPSVDVFDESSSLFPEPTSENILEGDATGEIDKEFFTFATVASTVARTPTTSQSTTIAEKQAVQVPAVMEESTSESGKKLIFIFIADFLNTLTTMYFFDLSSCELIL